MVDIEDTNPVDAALRDEVARLAEGELDWRPAAGAGPVEPVDRHARLDREGGRSPLGGAALADRMVRSRSHARTGPHRRARVRPASARPAPGQDRTNLCANTAARATATEALKREMIVPVC